MARNKSEEPPMKKDGWMATFSDLMNLLMCFFVLLFAMSSVDTDKWQQLVASFSTSYNVLQNNGGAGLDDSGMLIASGASQLAELSEYYSSIKNNQEGNKDDLQEAIDKITQEGMKESQEMGEKIEDFITGKGLENQVDVQVSEHYVCLNMKGALLFNSASADLTPEAVTVLSQVAEILRNYEDNLIEIEGHTDTIPINSGIFTSNDVLSDYRALAVFNYLVNDKGLSPKKLKHAGRGEYDPVASNDTAEGRAQNRRVEIKIYNSFSSR